MSELSYPEDLRYTSDHEWVAVASDGTARVGITSFAQNALERMAAKRAELDTWVGELYLEMHRATLTSQAAMKR